MSDSVELLYGNLLDFPNGITTIAHSCNVRNIMGAGIAKQIAERYPQEYEADYEFYNNEYDEDGQFIHPLGKFSKATVTGDFLPNNNGTIYNLYTQANIGTHTRQVHYEYFWQALKNMHDDIISTHAEPQVLGLPYGISCGLAGGSWNIILEMINDVFKASSIKTYVVNYIPSR